MARGRDRGRPHGRADRVLSLAEAEPPLASQPHDAREPALLRGRPNAATANAATANAAVGAVAPPPLDRDGSL